MSNAELMEAFETHSPDGIKKAFANGVDPFTLIDGRKPMDCLIASYLRSPLFADCLRVMLQAGATISDPLIKVLLFDDASGLRGIIKKSPHRLHQPLDLLTAFTSCRGVTALHICAEFNCTKCARVLIENGADVNSKAACDTDGIGGQTPIFHAVNSIFNFCRPVMELLVEAGADLQMKARSVLWGETMSWETVLYDVTPLSYAQCGLYRQFNRREDDTYSNLKYLYRRAHNTEAVLRNVPNKYLVEGH